MMSEEKNEFREVINACVRAELEKIKSDNITDKNNKTSFEEDQEYYKKIFNK